MLRTCLKMLAASRHAADRLKEAEPLYRRALAVIDEASYGPDYPSQRCGHSQQSRLIAAPDRSTVGGRVSPFRRALEIDEASYGPNHPHVALRLDNLALLLLDTGRFKEA